jgi:uncharacterized protein DUF1559
MTRRLSFVLLASLMTALMAAVPACKKKSTDTGGGSDSGPPPNPGPVFNAAASGEFVLFAHLKAKDIFQSDIFKEIKQAVAKAGATADWDDLEGKFTKEVGVKPTDIDSAAMWVTEIPMDGRGAPKFIAIVVATKAFDKAAITAAAKAKAEAGGFYSMGRDGLMHFPDDKTLVALSPNLKQRYLDGYAKGRTGWPMTAELAAAAGRHTLYAVGHMPEVPKDLRKIAEDQGFGEAFSARSMTLTADLKGRELSVAARVSFPDADSAGKAKQSVQQGITMATGFLDQVMSGQMAPELIKEFGVVMPAIKEAHRALKAAKVEVSGSDLTVAGTYKADFDIGAMVAEAVKKFRGTAEKMTASNNLLQIGLALHNHHDAIGRLPIHAVGPKGMLLKNANDKPLLSWRVAILPYIEQGNLYKQFNLDESWDSAHNKKLIEQMPKIYAPLKPGKPGYTHLQMVVGPNAMQPPSARLTDITDGTSNTIAVVEAAEPVIWTKPDDVMLTGKELPKDLKKKFGGLSPGGFNVVMWDGSVKFVKDSINEKTLGLLLNPRDNQPIPPGWDK